MFVGKDVGKGDHHAVALDRTGARLFDQALPDDEGQLRLILQELESAGGPCWSWTSPPRSGRCRVTVAQGAGVAVGYLPGLSMGRIADLHPGEAKTDARDAFIIAEAARTMPHTLRAVQVAEEGQAELSMLCGFDEDLTHQATAVSNRIHGLLIQIHSSLDHPAVLDLIRIWPTPKALRKAGQNRMAARLRKLAPKMSNRLAEQILHALDEQHVVVIGTGAAGIVLAELAGMLAGIHEARAKVLTRVEALVEAHPLHPVLTSMPAVGVRTAHGSSRT